MSDNQSTAPRPSEEEATDELENTAAAWRSDIDDTEAAESAEEVARGADRANEQPGYGREGS
jgi:hypothetical protein